VIISPKEITTIVINVIQQWFVRRTIASPLIIVEDKAKVLEMAISENSKGILIWWCTFFADRAIWNMIKLYFWWSRC
jgi:hypothetical protein